MVDGHCKRTIHSEANALIQAARKGAEIEGAVLYVTHTPCYDCLKMIVNVGIVKIYYHDFYDNKDNDLVFETAKKLGIDILQVKLKEDENASNT
jgi:dCMP deaminase